MKEQLDAIYLQVEQLLQLPVRQALLQDDLVNVTELGKLSYYETLRNLCERVLELLNQGANDPQVVKTWEYAQQLETTPGYGVSYNPNHWMKLLEMGHAMYRPVQFLEFAEMALVNPLLVILGHLYLQVTGKEPPLKP